MGQKFFPGWTPPKFEDAGPDYGPAEVANTTCPKGKSMVAEDEAAALASMGMDDILPSADKQPMDHRGEDDYYFDKLLKSCVLQLFFLLYKLIPSKFLEGIFCCVICMCEYILCIFITHLGISSLRLKGRGLRKILIMTGYIPEIILEAARELRKNMTEAEKLLWLELKGKKLGVKFLRQKPLFLYEEQNGFSRYCIPDFCSLDEKVIIEVDGDIHNIEEIYNLDREKEKLLTGKGFTIIRIENDEIFQNIGTVLKKIVASFP